MVHFVIGTRQENGKYTWFNLKDQHVILQECFLYVKVYNNCWNNDKFTFENMASLSLCLYAVINSVTGPTKFGML